MQIGGKIKAGNMLRSALAASISAGEVSAGAILQKNDSPDTLRNE